MHSPSGSSRAGVRTGVRRGGPDSALRVEADAVRADAVGPHPPIRQAAVRGDVERGEAAGERLGDDQRRVVGRDDHAVGELDAVRDLAGRAVRGDQRDDPGLGRARRPGSRSRTVDVDVAATVHDDLVPAMVGDTAQVGVPDHRPVGLPAQELRGR